jgi:hypothetical protein
MNSFLLEEGWDDTTDSRSLATDYGRPLQNMAIMKNAPGKARDQLRLLYHKHVFSRYQISHQRQIRHTACLMQG